MKLALILIKAIVGLSFLGTGTYFVLSGHLWSCGGFFSFLVVSLLVVMTLLIASLPLIAFLTLLGWLFGF